MGKKRKTKDFQKVKLKVGRKLKKAHDTSTTFKAAKVVLLEQLKKDAIGGHKEPLTHRKLSLKDLCLQLGHHNVRTRRQAIHGLKELVTENTSLLHGQLATIIEAVMPLAADSEAEIRTALMPLLKVIFGGIQTSTLQPYGSLVTAHVNCGLTHMSQSVKSFALRLLAEVLLVAHSSLVVNSGDLLATISTVLPAQPVSGESRETWRLAGMNNQDRLLSLKRQKLLFEAVHTLVLKALEQQKEHVTKPSHLIGQRRIKSDLLIGPPFAIPLLMKSHGHLLDDRTNRPWDQPDSFLPFYERLIYFLHSYWLEMTLSDSSECHILDASWMILSEQIFHLQTLLVKHLTKLREEGLVSADFGKLPFLRQLYSSKVFAKYLDVMPVSGRNCTATNIAFNSWIGSVKSLNFPWLSVDQLKFVDVK